MAQKEKPKTAIKREGVLKHFTYIDKQGITHTLTERQKLFCDAYLKIGARGIDAVYAAGYKPKNARVASSIAYENLIKPDIETYIRMKYEEAGFNDEDVTKEHLFLVNQLGDLNAKARGIDMYYKKKGGYAPEQHEHKITKVEIVKYNKD